MVRSHTARGVLAVLSMCALCISAADMLPGYDYVGYGVDVTRLGYPANYSYDVVKASVVVLSSEFENVQAPDGNVWKIPRNTEVKFMPEAEQCSFTSETTTVQAARDYQKEMETVFAIKIGFPGLFSTSLSTTYKETTKIMLSYDEYIVDSQAACLLYELGVNVRDLRNIVKNRLLELPIEFNNLEPGEYERFLSEFGTHVMVGIVSGGLMSQRATMSHLQYSNLRTESIDVVAEASVSFGVSVGVKDEHSESSETYLEYQSNSQSQQVKAMGGNSTLLNDYAAWSASLPNHPLPVQVVVRPLHELMTKDIFGGTVYITDRAASMNQAEQFYIQSRASIPALLPIARSCSVSMSDSAANHCRIGCLPSEILLGGACETLETERCRDDEDSCWPWRVTESRPVNDGQAWECRTSQDGGKPLEGQTTRAMAFCVPRTLLSDFAPPENQGIFVSNPPDSVVTTCKDTSDDDDWDASECIARCPSDYVVTGGGCSPGDSWRRGPLPHALSGSFPLTDGSGWWCTQRRDHGGAGGDVRVSGWARCTNWTSTFQFRPPHYGYSIESRPSGSTNEYWNECTAYCDGGQVLVGGGCDAGFGTNGEKWRLTSSWPRNNGWHCKANEDYGSSTYRSRVTCYAICMRFNVADETPPVPDEKMVIN